ncbi:glycosyltransferase family 2 protein [Candidatus Deianiraea vastatrix]|uniref:Glycosyltransferase n=1 Tax=Candidatus Deianiraea vastatrix TaxID=2163644 RepID=A0A5B8XH61_9RICK|nr:glycosyltransferase family 2 protein [Candidatus Deianiraea vastatrix]QED23514.1 Putative glycosyltransferase [Candidatus Deianiraea vastatrix]
MKLPVSVAIITYNGENIIDKCLEKLTNFIEVVVLDSGSSDKTIEIAEKYDNCKIYYNKFESFPKQKNLAISFCTQKWILVLDQDEILTDKALSMIANIVNNNKLECLRLYMKEYFLGRILSTPSCGRIKLFPQGKAHFDENIIVHEKLILSDELKIIDKGGCFIHYSTESIEQYIAKINKYSSLSANSKYLKGKRFSRLKCFTIFHINLIKFLIFKGEIFKGKETIISAFIASFYAFIKEVKLLEESVKRNTKED